MPPATQVTIVRHGESRWNLAKRLQGQLDDDNGLSETGRAQARAIAARFASRAFDALYSSDLSRAMETAREIAARSGREAVADGRLRERHFGLFQGLTWAQIEAQYPAELALHRAAGCDYVIPGGESMRQAFDRIVACFADLAARHPGGSIVVVSHVGALEAMLKHTLDIPCEAPRRFKLWNASVSLFTHEAGRWSLATWGDVSHLEGIGTRDYVEQVPSAD